MSIIIYSAIEIKTFKMHNKQSKTTNPQKTLQPKLFWNLILNLKYLIT